MTDRTCTKCGKSFAKPFYLKRHLERKTPCEPILAVSTSGALVCRYCGRAFTTQPSLSRHVNYRCKIANSEDGMEKLMEHTLQRQLAAQTKEVADLKAQVAAQSAQMAELTSLLKDKLALISHGAAPLSTTVAIQNNGPSTVNTGPVTTITQQINITPWSTETPIHVPVELVRAAFAENPKLREYCMTGDAERMDAEQSAPYVLEALLDLVKRAHSTPEQRNVYLSRQRADQVLVYVPDAAVSRKWEIVPLVEAIRRLFDGVSGQLHRLVLADNERMKLPLDVQGAVGWVPIHYDTEPDKYVADAKKSMAAHLENNRKALAAQET